MDQFIVIDFETANAKRVSACAMGYVFVENGSITETGAFFIEPVGGHAPFQTKIHGITEEDTKDQPDFGKIFQGTEVSDWFDLPVFGYSKFDAQVLNALSKHYDLSGSCEYYDVCEMAKEAWPDLKNHKLKTVAKHLDLPKFKHHDPEADAIACANILLAAALESQPSASPGAVVDSRYEFKGMLTGILADNVVNFREAAELLWFMEDNPDLVVHANELFSVVKQSLEDEKLDYLEAKTVKQIMQATLVGLGI